MGQISRARVGIGKNPSFAHGARGRLHAAPRSSGRAHAALLILFVVVLVRIVDHDVLEAFNIIEQAGEMDFTGETGTELVEARWLRKYSGMVGYIQLGFVHQGLVFLHETTTEWYERYQSLLDDVEGLHDIVIDDAHDDEDDE